MRRTGGSRPEEEHEAARNDNGWDAPCPAVRCGDGSRGRLWSRRDGKRGPHRDDPSRPSRAPTRTRRTGSTTGGTIVSATTGFQNPAVAGFTGSWLGNNGAASVTAWTAETTTLNAGVPTHESGGRLRSGGIEDRNHRIRRALAPYTPANTYYMSVLTQPALADDNSDGFVGVGFTDGGPSQGPSDVTLPSFKGLLIGFLSDGATTDFVVRHEGPGGAMVNQVLVDASPPPSGSPCSASISTTNRSIRPATRSSPSGATRPR